MSRQTVSSWGNVLRAEHDILDYFDRAAPLPCPAGSDATVLPFGNGRSYGDSCLNIHGVLVRTCQLDRFISFDPVTGVLRCEAGVLLADILRLFSPQGWFPTVVPGTQFVTVGGAIANDVHGKNHHSAGTFGCHVRRFELLRSDGRRLICASESNPEWFAATIGGLGLTGLITWAELQLRRIANPWIDVETIRFACLQDFFELSARSDADYEHTVAWIDCAAGTRRLGRGLFIRGNHAPAGIAPPPHRKWALTFPLVLPMSPVNPVSLRLFNTCYYHKQLSRTSRRTQHYDQFFFPLDGVREWPRIYGPCGFYQYQCVLPPTYARKSIQQLLAEIGQSGLGSFLAVLKVFGELRSPGMLSFPQSGVTLALDFPNVGERLHRLFARLDAIVCEAEGRLYPAKDGRMPGAAFRSGYPAWSTFSEYIDPRFSSSFWRRVTGLTV